MSTGQFYVQVHTPDSTEAGDGSGIAASCWMTETMALKGLFAADFDGLLESGFPQRAAMATEGHLASPVPR
jgi:hypothetical protein